MELKIQTTGKDMNGIVNMSTLGNTQDLLWVFMRLKDGRILLKSETTYSKIIGNVIKKVYHDDDKNSDMKIHMPDDMKVSVIYISSDMNLDKFTKVLTMIGSSKIDVIVDTEYNDEMDVHVAKAIKIHAQKGETYQLQPSVAEIYTSIKSIEYAISVDQNGNRKDDDGNVVEPKISLKTSVSSLKKAIEKYTAFAGEVPVIDIQIDKDGLTLLFGDDRDLSSPSAKIPIDGEFVKFPSKPVNVSVIPMITTVLKNLENTKVTDDVHLEIYESMVSLKSMLKDDSGKIKFIRMIDLSTREPIEDLIEEEEIEDEMADDDIGEEMGNEPGTDEENEI